VEPALPPALARPTPASIEDLKAIEKQTKQVLEKVVPATVGLQIGAAAGSGVIINEEGIILTAGHVSGAADRPVVILMSDGRRLKGKTLGGNNRIDSGMVKITDKGKWSWAEMGDSSKIKPGQWCIAVGHPGGYKSGRSPVVRVGRVLTVSPNLLRTDCTLVGGDSGGPLFDMNGKVIGIHSRIGASIADNVHVPVDTYKETWDRLAKGEVWGGGLSGLFGGGRPRPASKAWLGIAVEPDAKDCRISEVTKDSPAEKAGLKVDDVITKFDGKKVTVFEDLAAVIKDKKVGDKVDVDVKRGMEVMTLKVTLTKRTEE